MSKAYEDLKRRMASGWNTWNTRSVTSHVLLPEAFAINLGFREYRGGTCLKTPLIGRQGEHDEVVHPGPHAHDGRYTSLRLKWRDLEVSVETGHDGADLVVLVTPLADNPYHASALIVDSAMLWNRPGKLSRESNSLTAELPGRTITAYATADPVAENWTESTTPYLCLPLTEPVGIATGRFRPAPEIRAILEQRRREHAAAAERFGDLADVYDAVRTSMAWDTIYEPDKDRVVSTVSRLWNTGGAGYSLFCWDNYFAGYLALIDCKELAYANLVEITREKVEEGFVPNCAHGTFSSHDRSQPCVGSRMLLEVYRRYREKWLLEELFDDLLEWNRWWPAHRDTEGYLCWGSEPYNPAIGNYWELNGVNDRYGAALESGLDNSPMYDEIPFDAERHQLMLGDVGLMALYVMDCEALAAIADELGRDEAAELRKRAATYRLRLAGMWDDETGLFLNRRTDTAQPEHRLSPTHFYALLARCATPDQAARMLREHFYNPKEFWGEWILPSISRDDKAFPEQSYWRGRIWAPMNFLVYLGLREYDLPEARADLADKSRRLLLREWLEKGHVHENYCPLTGEGCNVQNSDRFYHWGALLGMVALIEAGQVAPPEAPLSL